MISIAHLKYLGFLMKKFLISRGNGWAISTPKNIIKLLCINPENTQVLFKIKEKVLYISKITPNDAEYKDGLIRKFSKMNSSWCLYLPNSIIELLEINPEKDEIDIEVNDNILIVKKA